MIAQLADGSAVGAWMLKANPRIWDIGSAIDQRLDLSWWRLAPTYRAELVTDGQPCVLWITRGDDRIYSGVWGYGRIIGEPFLDSGDPDDPLWVDEVAQRQVRPRISVELQVLEAPIRREDLASDPRLARMEILRVPRIGNPAAVTPGEWEALQTLLE